MRKIEPKMIEWLDEKLKSNGLAEEAMATKDARLLFSLSAEACVGIRETGGNNSGPMVRLLQDTIGTPDREPWCMSFVQTCLAYAEVKTGLRSPIYSSEHCMTVWKETPAPFRVKASPLRGAIAIWNYEGTSNGHTGIVLEGYYRKYFNTVEGNTNKAGSREGDGVYYKKRMWWRDGSLVRVGFLKPF